MMCIGAIALVSLAAGVMSAHKKKTKKCGVRHAATKLVEGVNDFLDDLGVL